jgi:hypothetical protein
MSKGESGGKQTNTAARTSAAPDSVKTTEAMEQLVVAFAEHLGRIVGTVQAKADGWMDRDALTAQIASVRDGAADLLEQLSDGMTVMTKTAKTATTAAVKAASTARSKGRSGGVVDAPGKKHRKPVPADARAASAGAKSSNMRSVKPSMKTVKLRGRG